MRRRHATRVLLTCAVASLSACRERTNIARAPSAAKETTLAARTDSIPDERPDSVVTVPPDSLTMRLALLPAPSDAPMSGAAAALAERAVFAARTQRWFMARTIDSVVVLDVGRVDGGVPPGDDSSSAFAQMIRSHSPVQPGMTFILHHTHGLAPVSVRNLQLSGRRIVARLDGAAQDSAASAFPVEWRGQPPVPPFGVRRNAACDATASPAVESAIARYAAGRDEILTVLRGCFQTFRALIVIRPDEITPESTERVTLVRADGTTRAGKLRDLSYPLHQLQSITDVNGDGIHEIVVRSARPAMETWAALRMTDSVTFTRFASGFTIEKR
jgi:hypothetical protein